MTTYPINEIKELQIRGRISRHPEGVTFFWTGSSLDFYVSGSELSLEIDVPESALCPWVCLYLNGHLLQRVMLRRGRQVLPVYDHLNYSEPKQIRIIKDSPALLQNAVYEGETLYTIRCITTDGSFYPLPEKKLKIELIGDSITSGEGLYGYPGLITEDLWFFTAQPDLHYGMRIAAALDADLRIVTQAGWGVNVGYNNRPDYNIPSIYEQVCGVQTSNAASALGSLNTYDFSSWQPDLVIVHLGTNDAAAFENPGYLDPKAEVLHKMKKTADGSCDPGDLQKVYTATVCFLDTLRRRNPNAHILWCYGMMGNALEPTLRGAVADYAQSHGDPAVSYVSLPDTLPGEFGSVDHPGIPSHKTTADTLLSALITTLTA